MPCCQHCGEIVDEGVVFCPKCGEILAGEDTEWQEFQIQGEVDEAKHRANMYTILAIVLATVGLMGGGVLCVGTGSVGFFGIAFVCLGVGSTAWAGRYEHKARSLKRQLSRCN